MTINALPAEATRKEGKACDAVVRLIEQETGETRAAICHPEKDGLSPPVDLRVSLGTVEYATEHT